MNYTITIPDTDRKAIAAAISKLVEALTNARLVLESESQVSVTAPIATQKPAEPPRARQLPPTVEARDRWATDKNGNPWKPTSPGVRAIDVHIWKTAKTNTFLRVTWQNNGEGHGNANCFDGDLWPLLIERSKQGEPTRLYVKQAGSYTNIVGVRA